MIIILLKNVDNYQIRDVRDGKVSIILIAHRLLRVEDVRLFVCEGQSLVDILPDDTLADLNTSKTKTQLTNSWINLTFFGYSLINKWSYELDLGLHIFTSS